MTWSSTVPRRRASRWITAALQPEIARSSRSAVVTQSVLLVAVGAAVFWFGWTWPRLPFSVYAPFVVVGGLYLTPIAFLIVGGTYLVEMVALTVKAAQVPDAANQLPQLLALSALAIVIVIMSATSRSRARLGVQGSRGESMFVDLRDRLKAFGELPSLPGGWHAETAVESAYGQSFSGDFVVATRSSDGRWFEVVLVDVSGKGVQAGTRSLLLSGALGGLLGEQEPTRFLTAANNYLLRQNWDEGFATAVHVSIDLATGDYTIGSAGHPPAVQFNNGSGRWEVLGEAAGPLLGVIDDATYVRSYRRLGRGDALVLYTDGVVESRFRDLTVGVDRMLGAAERLVRGGFAGGAKRLCASARAGETDDRAVVMIWRD
ncbi:MAG TPA: PP2C family protein-serine/threonine phosphatase [Lapillicoccus sp.]|nr:PP2C family protein-serine/threonine phosphatase [Lapillicoccus sp.]